MSSPKRGTSWGERIVLAGMVAFLALCSLTLIYGGGDLLLSLGKHLAAWTETRHWNQVPMQIDSVALVSKANGDNSYIHRVEANYSYEIGTTQYQGDRAWLLTEYVHLQGVHQCLVDQLTECQKSGQSYPGYVDPRNPTRSLLDRSFRWLWWISTFGIALMFGGLGLAIPLFGVDIVRDTRRTNSLKLKHPREPWLWEAQTAEGRIRPNGRWILPTLVLVGFATVATPMLVDVWLIGEPIDFGFGVMLVTIPIATVAAAIDVALHTWHWKRFGTQSLQVVNWPLRIGKLARFRIEWKGTSVPQGPLYVTLCIDSRNENVGTTFRMDAIVEMAADGFWQWDCALPADPLPSRDSEPDRCEETSIWTLKITESPQWLKSRLGFQAEYNLPVFR